MAVVYAELRFMQIEQMNQFLRKLTRRLIGKSAGLLPETTPLSFQNPAEKAPSPPPEKPAGADY